MHTYVPMYILQNKTTKYICFVFFKVKLHYHILRMNVMYEYCKEYFELWLQYFIICISHFSPLLELYSTHFSPSLELEVGFSISTK